MTHDVIAHHWAEVLKKMHTSTANDEGLPESAPAHSPRKSPCRQAGGNMTCSKHGTVIAMLMSGAQGHCCSFTRY